MSPEVFLALLYDYPAYADEAQIETIGTPTLSGASSGYAGAFSYSYAGNATSSSGHTLQYLFDWGDGETSGWTTSPQPHSFFRAGTYPVRVMARCAVDTSIASSWSSATMAAFSDVMAFFTSETKKSLLPRSAPFHSATGIAGAVTLLGEIPPSASFSSESKVSRGGIGLIARPEQPKFAFS